MTLAGFTIFELGISVVLLFFRVSNISNRIRVSIVLRARSQRSFKRDYLTFGRAGHELVMPPYPTCLASLNVLYCSRFINSTWSITRPLAKSTDFVNYAFVLTSWRN